MRNPNGEFSHGDTVGNQEGGTERKLVLPEDQELKSKLRRKVDEYTQRDPSGTDIDTAFRKFILLRLLRTGEADVGEIKKELEARFADQENIFPGNNYSAAVDVVRDYVTTGGRNVGGGTGLK